MLTDRQREIWERLQGLGEFDGKPMKVTEVAKELGITTNNVYVTKRRVKTLLGMENKHSPKRIVQQQSNLESAVESLQKELSGYEEEKARLHERLEQIEHERPAVEAALERLRAVTTDAAENVAEPVAA